MPAGGPAVERPGPGDEPEVTVDAEPDSTTLRAWDRLVADTPGSDVAQLSGWAQVRRRAGFSPLYVLARVSGEPVGGALVLHRRPVPGLGSVAYLPFGPVLPTGPRRGEIAEAVGCALADLARQRLAALFVQPMAGDTDVTDGLLRLGFRPSTAGIAPAASIAIDLSDPVDRLRADLRSGTRASIRRAAAQRVQVRRGGADDLGVVADLLAHTAGHHGFAAVTPEHLGELYQALEPGHIVVFIAERDGIPLAADVLTSCGGVLTLRLTGMRRDDRTRRLGATALLRWETVLWARAHDYESLDLGGIPLATVDPLRAGHTDLATRVDGRTYYKASFGGRPVRYPTAVEMLPSAAVRVGYDLSHRSALGTQLLDTARRALRGAVPRRALRTG